MFQKIKECLYNYEFATQKVSETGEVDKEDIEVLDFFDIHLAEELIKDTFIDHEKVAKIIMAFVGIKERIEIQVK